MADQEARKEEIEAMDPAATSTLANAGETAPSPPRVDENNLHIDTAAVSKDYAIGGHDGDAGSDSGASSSPHSSDEKTTYAPIGETKNHMTRIETNKSIMTASSTTELRRLPSRNPNHRWYHYLMLKRKSIPPLPEEQQVSREYKANFFSIITFQWITPLMAKGYQRSLEPEDLWLVNPNRTADLMSSRLSGSFNRRTQRGDSRPLLGALYETFKFEFLLGGACQLTASIIQVVNPFILRYLITFSEEAYYAHLGKGAAPHVGRGVGLVFAVTILQAIQSSCTNQYLYRGMMNGGQSRSALISLIFDKAMRLSGRARAGGYGEEIAPSNIKPGSKEEKNWLKRRLAKMTKPKRPDEKDGAGWSNGRILNLMSVDTYRIDQACGMFHMIWTAPIQVVIVLILLLININYSALSGFGLIVISMPLLAKAIGSLFTRRKAINKITDQRVSLTQEIMLAVRFVKYFGWETSFLQRLENIRSREIRSIQWLMAIRNGINAISMSMPIFASMLSFITYALTSHRLNPALIFSSLGLFNALRIPLNLLPLVIGQVVDGASSVERIQEFLLAEEAKDGAVWDYDSKNAIQVKDASFTWEQNPKSTIKNGAVDASKTIQQEKMEKKAAKKSHLDEKRRSKHKANKSDDAAGSPTTDSPAELDAAERPPFTIQDLNFAVKRDELIAVIGTVGSGKSSLLAALAGDMRRTDGSVTLGASRAFCPQYAWIQNATVQDNILFGKQMDRDWYESVVEACALRPDLEILPNGDMTEIGERGITVSGGQKQRLNIARAIYHNSDIVLMDDPLSAVDAHVGRHIMDHAICGLMKHKCRILATHQLWVLNRCDRILWLDDGKIIAFDTFDHLMATNKEFVSIIANNAQEEQEVTKTESKEGDEDEKDAEKKTHKKLKSKKNAAALMQAEERAVNSVSWSVYAAYVKASGSYLVLPLILFLLFTSQGANIVTSLWLSWWTGDKFHYSTGAYIGVYAGLGAFQALLMFLFSVSLSYFGTEASKAMLQKAITRALRAPMSFFDTTPLGRITNRFSKDIDTMDNALTDAIRFFCLTMGMICSVFILIIAYYYYFAVALGPLFVLFLFSAGFYRSSAREIKRHEAVLRSHVFAKFSEAVNGVATIRAYGLESRFSKVIRETVDSMDGAYFLTFANQRWLSVRLDMIGIMLVFVVGILVVTSRFSVSPSTGGLVLSYILSIVQMIQFTVRQLAEVENDMNSTERIHYYGSQLEEEAPLHLAPVAESWPAKGEIVFRDVEMRYRENLPLVLRGLNMHIRGGERIGVVGRTGAGKSSIMSTIFRLVELSGGSITIDGINIATVGLHDLRSRMAIIPQDPTLFKGTIRSNLDPFGKYNDLELWNALRQADLVSGDAPAEDRTGRIHLDSPVEEEGLNFSLGQRQLMALARALVRNSQIIVCDEATSSVDMETDAKIQKTIAEGFKGKTLLCIAHRLRTILQYDRICVMDQGEIAELDTPLNLWMKGGIFRGMCDRSKITREDFDKTDIVEILASHPSEQEKKLDDFEE